MMNGTKDTIKKFNIRLTKSLGQNFLNDERIVQDIADTAELCKTDLVIEVGPGIGNLTHELALRAGKVIAVEIDKHLMTALKENLKGFSNVVILNEDILKSDIKGIIKKELEIENPDLNLNNVKVVANLPYYITTPIIMKFLEDKIKIDMMVFMVQKEVAERMAAKPGGKEYGALSVAVQYYSQPELAFIVPPHCFIPKPEVDSAVVKLSIHKEPPVKLNDEDMFFRTIKASFGQRRKTLVNALANSGFFMESKEDIKVILGNLGIDEKQRGETLSITQFAELANAFSIKNSKNKDKVF